MGKSTIVVKLARLLSMQASLEKGSGSMEGKWGGRGGEEAKSTNLPRRNPQRKKSGRRGPIRTFLPPVRVRLFTGSGQEGIMGKESIQEKADGKVCPDWANTKNKWYRQKRSQA